MTEEFVCFVNALISGSTGPIRKNILVIDSPLIEEGRIFHGV